MKNEYWHKKWQHSDIGFNQSQPNELLKQYFRTLNLKPGARVFVPLCGKSIDMIWLREQGYQVLGIELSLIACEAFFKENNITTHITQTDNFSIFQGDNITLYAGDFFKLSKTMLGKIDAVYDRAALIALPAELRQQYAKHLSQVLGKDALMLLITVSYNQNEMPGPPFSVDETEVKALYSANFNINQLYNEPFLIPQHLLARGLMQANEQAYRLIGKNFKAS